MDSRSPLPDEAFLIFRVDWCATSTFYITKQCDGWYIQMEVAVMLFCQHTSAPMMDWLISDEDAMFRDLCCILMQANPRRNEHNQQCVGDRNCICIWWVEVFARPPVHPLVLLPDAFDDDESGLRTLRCVNEHNAHSICFVWMAMYSFLLLNNRRKSQWRYHSESRRAVLPGTSWRGRHFHLALHFYILVCNLHALTTL